MNLDKIKKIAEEKRITIKSIAKNIGMTDANLHRCIREGKIQAGDLEHIAKILECPIDEFFDENVRRKEFKIYDISEPSHKAAEPMSIYGDPKRLSLDDKVDFLIEKFYSLESDVRSLKKGTKGKAS